MYQIQNRLNIQILVIVICLEIRYWKFWFVCLHEESNLDHRFRKPTFYPLNYGDLPHPALPFARGGLYSFLCKGRINFLWIFEYIKIITK
jgi:hypothetical protein